MDTFAIVLIAILVLGFLTYKIFFNKKFVNIDKFDKTDKTDKTDKSDDEKQKLYVFVSSHCPHCHTYLNNYHSDVCALAKSKGIEVEKVQSDGSNKSNELFAKYDVQFIPTGILVKDGKVKKNLGSNLSIQNVKEALEE